MKKFLQKRACLYAVFLIVAAAAMGFTYRSYASQKLPLSHVTVILDPGHGGWGSCAY